MEVMLGWKPFQNVDPSMTETNLESKVNSVEAWLRDTQHLEEGKHYRKRVAGAWTEFHVAEGLHEALVEAYVSYALEQAGGEATFNLRNAYKYPPSHGRSVRDLPVIRVRPARNPGKSDKHSRKA